ncbi:MAG: cyanophycin synthetase [Candidatus Omnitrophota bacterium]|nr:cyanophycin synthetase [Candidatus Omnitrophota bacterium]
MRLLIEWFGHPERAFFSVLIAGTKGKGSTGFFLESILEAGGNRTGFYSSPHLQDPRERVRIGGKMISKSAWQWGLNKIRRVLSQKRLPHGTGDFTYFEIMTLLGMLVFAKTRVQVGIFEVGMGGRLDATNVLNASLGILTPIHLDHEAFLGHNIAAIAREKAAIIRRGAQIVVSTQSAAAMREIKKQAKAMRARLISAGRLNRHSLGLKGEFQRVNAGAALKAASVLREAHGFSVPDKAIRSGLRAKNWPGRFEQVVGSPEFVIDSAHNPSAVQALVKSLRMIYGTRDRVLIFGVARDKNSGAMLRYFSRFFSNVILTKLPNIRSQEMGVLLTQARRYFEKVLPAAKTSEAMSLARKSVSPKGVVVVAGSFYLSGEVRTLLGRL